MAGFRELELGDASVFAISPEAPETSRDLLAKIEADGSGPVGFQLLSDPHSETIDHYGVRDSAYAGTENDGLPHPAVFVLDEDGVVRWSRIETDYKQRPEVSEIQAALDEIRNDP